MKKLTLFLVLLISCSPVNEKEQAETNILQAEREFAQMAREVGIVEAFLAYADPNAVLMRNDSLIIGKNNITLFMGDINYGDAVLSWEPDFVEASSSGDLGYTYGKYTYSATGPDGTLRSAQGVFHTVWKKQPDGSWKYVWD